MRRRRNLPVKSVALKRADVFTKRKRGRTSSRNDRSVEQCFQLCRFDGRVVLADDSVLAGFAHFVQTINGSLRSVSHGVDQGVDAETQNWIGHGYQKVSDSEETLFEKRYYDNLDRVIQTEQYDSLGPCCGSSSSSSSMIGSGR